MVMPLLVMLTFGIIDFGLLFYVHLSLENGVSQAARFGVTGQTMPGLTREDSIKAMMRQSTPTLTLTDDNFRFSHLAGGAWAAGTGGPGDVAKVTVTYMHHVLVLRPFFRDGYVNLQVESSMKNEDRFQ